MLNHRSIPHLGDAGPHGGMRCFPATGSMARLEHEGQFTMKQGLCFATILVGATLVFGAANAQYYSAPDISVDTATTRTSSQSSVESRVDGYSAATSSAITGALGAVLSGVPLGAGITFFRTAGGRGRDCGSPRSPGMGCRRPRRRSDVQSRHLLTSARRDWLRQRWGRTHGRKRCSLARWHKCDDGDPCGD